MQERSREERQDIVDNINSVNQHRRRAKKFEIRLVKAFKDVFGLEGNHTGFQILVLGYLMEFSGSNSISHPNDPIFLARMAGRREMLNLILGTARYTKLHELENEALLHVEKMEEYEDGY